MSTAPTSDPKVKLAQRTSTCLHLPVDKITPHQMRGSGLCTPYQGKTLPCPRRWVWICHSIQPFRTQTHTHTLWSLTRILLDSIVALSCPDTKTQGPCRYSNVHGRGLPTSLSVLAMPVCLQVLHCPGLDAPRALSGFGRMPHSRFSILLRSTQYPVTAGS